MNGIFVRVWIFQTAVGKHSVALSIVNPATTNRAFVQELTERECTVVLKPLRLSFTCATAARETMMTVHGNCFHTYTKNVYMLIGRCTAAEILQRLKQTSKHNRATKLYANFECASGWRKRKTTTSIKVIQSTLQQSRGPKKPLGF